MWRHGDILIAAVEAIPQGAKRQHGAVLALGELTGHSHRVEEADTAALWEWNGTMLLEVTAPSARLVHEEHQPITLPRGSYRFWFQREYTPQATRRVID